MTGAQVAVIGAGAAGLVTARELLRAGHTPTVYEQADRVGGVWVYNPQTDDDLSGRAASQPVYSSMYDSLRTNLPSDLMAFLDYPFDARGGGEDDWHRFPHHSRVLIYLENFCRDHKLQPCLKLSHTVTRVTPVGHTWQVCSTGANPDKAITTATFDAVVICNGHYSVPRLPQLPGIENFQGDTLHSHNYRDPQPFTDKKVVLWGAAASGADISREILRVAREVHWCGHALRDNSQSGASARQTQPSKPSSTSGASQVYTHGDPVGFDHQGRLIFKNEPALDEIDSFMFCTGYDYQFPFLDKDIVTVTDNWVHPLYQDLLSPAHPNLAFIGLPYLIVPFPLFEIQARWFSRLLAGQFDLPDKATMARAIDSQTQSLRAAGVETRHWHKLADKQTPYFNQLATQCGERPLPDWFGQLTQAAQHARLANPAHFRDHPLQNLEIQTDDIDDSW
jgi:thioredoxin reductase